MTNAEICEHGDYKAACLECLGMPQPRPKVQPAPARARRPTTRPRSAAEEILNLHGDKDISIPVPEVEPTFGARSDWLLADGYPHYLRPNGWIYLRMGDALVARVVAKRMLWRDHREWRSGPALDSGRSAGPGLVFEVDPDTWEEQNHALGELADRQRQGYRYLITSPDGSRIAHLVADSPIPEDFKV